MVKTSQILVIDDEAGICEFLKDMFALEGYTVSAAADAEEGLQMAEKLRPDLVLLDLKMPKMSGMDVLRRIKAIDEATPIIMMTGYGTMDTARTAMRLGAFDYVTKPFELAHVRAVARDAISQRINQYVDRLKAGKDLLNAEDISFLDSIGSCRPDGACIWEAVVRGLILYNTEFLFEWRDQPGVSEREKEGLLRLTEIVNGVRERQLAGVCD